MPRKPTPQPDDPAQSKRFIDTAREVEADDSEAFDRAFKKIAAAKPVRPQGPKPKRTKG